MKKLYKNLKPIFKKNDGIFLENLPFDFNQHYYVDSAHYNRKATKIIANSIFAFPTERYLNIVKRGYKNCDLDKSYLINALKGS